jgi:hypothetical protein
MKNYLIRDGKLTDLSMVMATVITFGGILGTLYFQPPFWLGIIILVTSFMIGAIAAISAKAQTFGLKPFTNDPLGWRKIKQSQPPSSTSEDQAKEEIQDKRDLQ